MRFLLPTFLLCALATMGNANPATKLAEVWDRYVRICGLAMQDAQKFVDSVPTWAPAGLYGAETTPDGRMYKLNIAMNGYFDSYSRTILTKGGSESCATHYNEGGIEDSAQTAAAFEALVRSRIPQQTLIGGHFPELYGYQNKPLERNPHNYQYTVLGILPDPKLGTFIQITNGFISMSVYRSVPLGN